MNIEEHFVIFRYLCFCLTFSSGSEAEEGSVACRVTFTENLSSTVTFELYIKYTKKKIQVYLDFEFKVGY